MIRVPDLSEAAISAIVRSALECPGIKVWRNNTGAMLNKDNRPIRFGLCPGSSDFIGIRTVRITPEMVGADIGQFLAVEVKSVKGKLSESQGQFLKLVNNAGGIGFVARSLEDVMEKLK